MRSFLGYLAIFSITLSLALGGYIGRERYDTHVYDYNHPELLENDDHSCSDFLVRNSLLLYSLKRKDEAFQQLDIVWQVDSMYWPVMYCKAVMIDMEGKWGYSIRYYERAVALMEEPGLTFQVTDKIKINEITLLNRLSELYYCLNSFTHDEYHWHLYEMFQEMANECSGSQFTYRWNYNH